MNQRIPHDLFNSLETSYPFRARAYRVDRPALSAYIHIPFCLHKCIYCDFLSYSPNQQRRLNCHPEDYADLLIQEIKSTALQYPNTSGQGLETIYFGGGTPTVLPSADLCRILNALDSTFSIAPNAEITIEMNPETLRQTDFGLLRSAGFNRLSIGVQAIQDHLLRRLGRLHRFSDVEALSREARRQGFTNLSADLILALPGQSSEMIEASIAAFADLGFEHISAYSLILEEDTPLYCAHQRGLVELPDEDIERELVHTALCCLRQHDYQQYEISNFARNHQYSRHNAAYWLGEYYYGFGLGAASYLAGHRRINPKLPEELITHQYSEDLFVDREEAMREQVCFALRLLRPFAGSDFQRRFACELPETLQAALEKHHRLGLLEALPEGQYILSEKGLDFADQIALDLI
ncbi:MAG: radical SAM family heme chaperone HemW [Eubacteriales bacterium]|nr:radical SAM family heme chaperone HemW [Eubacteriales bacterium]